MTEPDGSALETAAGNPEAGSHAAPDGSADGVAPNARPGGLQPEDNRAKANAKGRTPAEDAVQSHDNPESQPGRSIVPPSPDDPPERWEAFYRAGGRPDHPDGYEFRMPAELPSDFAYEDGLASQFRDWAHGTGLNPRQAQELHDRFVRYQAGLYSEYRDNREQAAGDAHERLVRRWGSPEGERFRRNVELANRAIRNLGGDALVHALKMGNLVNDDGAIANDALAIALARAGEALFAEDTLTGSGDEQANPWRGDSEHLGLQGQYLRQDPERARAMIRAAGLTPSSFGLDD